ncbi:hypothetical protein Sjap_012967 [Stephania japonica]|uniref:Uncharacterized protein n=1 Tax=Stephania japonica TaxID=461633 RepID=A0AAP0IXU6_9MAGN
MKEFLLYTVPSRDNFPELEKHIVLGKIIYEKGDIVLNSRRRAVTIYVVNSGDRPIQVLDEHWHLFGFFVSVITPSLSFGLDPSLVISLVGVGATTPSPYRPTTGGSFNNYLFSGFMARSNGQPLPRGRTVPRGGRGIPSGRPRPAGSDATHTIGTSIPAEPHGLSVRGGRGGRDGRGCGTVSSLSILGSRSLGHELYSASPSPSIPSPSQVLSTSSSRTIPNYPLQSPSVSSSLVASNEGRTGSQVAGAPRAPQRRGIHFLWESAIHDDLVRAAYDTMASIKYTALMSKLKKNRVQPDFVIDEAWRRYLGYWKSEYFLIGSKQASKNKNTEVEGPGIGVSKHGGGSMSFVTTNERLAQLKRRRQELTQATPNQQVDEMALYYDVVGDCPKGRVYSHGREDMMILEPMVPCSDFNNIADQLRHVVAFMRSQFGMTMDRAGPSQPLPPPQEQQQQVQMDPADPLQHDDVDRERQDWVVEDVQIEDT